jgi:hypothetical protein
MHLTLQAAQKAPGPLATLPCLLLPLPALSLRPLLLIWAIPANSISGYSFRK